MEIALYHPNGGYYAAKSTNVGKDGDFFTSVSVGEVFGKLLAHRIHKLWIEMDRGSNFCLIELGANNASLCIDILKELKVLEPKHTFNYHIVEPLTKLQHAQKQHLEAQQIEAVSHHSSLTELKDLTGVFLSNELFDAFPIEQISFDSDSSAWKKLHIGLDGDQFTEVWQDIALSDSDLIDFCNSLGTEFPDRYRTEFRPGLPQFLSQVSNSLKQGMVLTIDYGFPHSHFYHSSRTEGTLQTYFKHQKDDNPLEDPGSRDITAHVDFTQLLTKFQQAGFELHDFTPQHRHLTHFGKDWLTSLEQNFSPATVPLIKQFQTLTHPGMMGQQFHMLEVTKNLTMKSAPTTASPAEVLEMPHSSMSFKRD